MATPIVKGKTCFSAKTPNASFGSSDREKSQLSARQLFSFAKIRERGADPAL
jgi:hypothetical protein